MLIGLVARAALDPCDPVRLLAIAKHPLVRLGLPPAALQAGVTALERDGLRGPRPNDWGALEARLQGKGDAQAAVVLHRLRAALAGVEPSPERVAAADLARALAETLEALALGEDGTPGALWAGPAGEAAGQMLSALMTESDGLPEATPSGFVQLIDALMAGVPVRQAGGAHPRLRILGAIEARLIRADRLVLAGLEEGVWPQGAPIDPFLSRPMRAALGLPPPERRTGLSAHDFAQAACAPEVYLLHAERLQGQPAVESRWLWRLKTLARGAAWTCPGGPSFWPGCTPWTARRLRPRGPRRLRPAPGGAARQAAGDPGGGPDARPLRGLCPQRAAPAPLDRPDEPMEQRARGTAIHVAFERFSGEWPVRDGDPGGRFASLYMEELRKAGAPRAPWRGTRPGRRGRAWIADMEERRRAAGRRRAGGAERRGPFPYRPGRVHRHRQGDRIELTADGCAHVLDFKTGPEPSQKMVTAGFSPQLTLTAAIIARGGFAGLGPRLPGDLVYIRITGREPAGKEVVSLAAGGRKPGRGGEGVRRAAAADRPLRGRGRTLPLSHGPPVRENLRQRLRPPGPRGRMVHQR
ncbi:MAG: PD-(D/E)XK nuclease family protein [Caulobacteraceae bacterium]